MDKTYIAIDLKSFYASVECVERELDPLKTNLVVADESRTEKTICLAVSPSLKAHGIPGRARLFEVVQKVAEVNDKRRWKAPGHKLTGKSTNTYLLEKHPDWAVDYIVAKPRMSYYMEYSASVYKTYLKYVAPEDIHVYSIDEVFIDATPYLKIYNVDGRGFARMLIRDVLQATGITATAGVAPNLYLCKVAMDIVAKHIEPDKDGSRIAELDEYSYRRLLWDHRPLTDFWRIGPGIARRLEKIGLYTLGDVARCSLGGPNDFHNEDLLFKTFGVNAELIIDHAWGYEPCTIAHIKAYKPENNSVSSGQVLSGPYTFDKARLVVIEMADAMALDLVEKGVVTSQVSLGVGYDVQSLKDPDVRKGYKGQIAADHYGRSVPKSAHGSARLSRRTASTRMITEAILSIYDREVDPALLIRRIYLGANLLTEDAAGQEDAFEQLDLFADHTERDREDARLEREKRRQEAMLKIKHRFGKNAILRGTSLEEGATARERNGQIGGHKA